MNFTRAWQNSPKQGIQIPVKPLFKNHSDNTGKRSPKLLNVYDDTKIDPMIQFKQLNNQVQKVETGEKAAHRHRLRFSRQLIERNLQNSRLSIACL